MAIEIIDMASWGSGDPNEDHVGHAAEFAWVIDGATDLVDAPLVGKISDAAWLAETAQIELLELALSPPERLADLPALLNEKLRRAFRKSARIEPEERWQHPSAAALIARVDNNQLEWVGLSDCALIIESVDGLKTVGVGGADAGDRRIATEVSRLQKIHGLASEAERRSHILPQLRNVRTAKLNQPNGYAVLSITPPPHDLIDHGNTEVTPGAHALLATDGLMRLIEIYARYDARSLLSEAIAHGVDGLLRQLREIEESDADCSTFPRLKQSDDATGILLRCV